MTLARLKAVIDADAGRFQKVLDQADKASSTVFGRIRNRLAAVKKDFREELGKGLAIGGGVALAAKGLEVLGGVVGKVGDFIGASKQAASDLNETLSKSRVIFGDSAGTIEAWAAGAADAFGQSKRAAVDAASGFAGLFSTVGIEIGKSTGMATKLTELGSDLASFFNTDVATALEALRSGLSGESEPLRRFNVFLSETAVTAKLVQMGATKVDGAFTEAQKATARYQLILEQTTTAQGDFARTSDELANSQRRADARLENLQATLGQKFLPIARQVTEWQIDFIEGMGVAGDAIGHFIRTVTLAPPTLEDLRGRLAELESTSGLLGRDEGSIAKLRNEIQALEDVARATAEGGGLVRLGGTVSGFAAKVATAAQDVASKMPKALEASRLASVAVAARTPGDIADALRTGRTTWQDAVQLLASDLENQMSTAAEIAKIRAELAGANIAAGLASKDPIVQHQTEATIAILTGRLATLSEDARTYGLNVGQGLAGGLASKQHIVEQAASRLAGAIGSYLKVSSPAEKGPLSLLGGPEGWGVRIGALLDKGLSRSMPDVGGMIGVGPRFGGSSGVGEGSPVTARVPAAGLVGNGRPGGAGDTYNVTINHPTGDPAEADIGFALRRVAWLGGGRRMARAGAG